MKLYFTLYFSHLHAYLNSIIFLHRVAHIHRYIQGDTEKRYPDLLTHLRVKPKYTKYFTNQLMFTASTKG